MKLEHELIRSTGVLPFNAFSFSAKDVTRVIPQHWHQSTELIFCLSGALNVWIEGILYRMNTGDIIVIDPNTTHYTQSPVTNHILCIQLPMQYLQELTENQFMHSFVFDLNTVSTSLPSPLLTQLQQSLGAITAIIETAASTTTLSAQIKEQSLVLEIISQLVSNCSSAAQLDQNKMVPNSIVFMNAVTKYINEHFIEVLTLHCIANAFNYSDSYFSRAFKQNFNMNFHDFLIFVRLNDAVNRMLTSDDTLSEIARQSGFDNYRNFYNSFVRIYQEKPKNYRENAREIAGL
ncbi:helix-turn-helix domain-containing protein [Lapidilactobacillus mulanensis]|uniref:Helix-turn-helix domain-containing protein n=1 Tax=Lapidilactobacillus mulanensis TaxID=2485999 RepID=A0ABW4DL59_9LACO|nr:AraC family transcriptional regulator [Lapidilactobacillus mulanensis]